MKRRDARWIVEIWKPFRAIFVLIVALTLVSTAARVVLPLILKQTFDGLETALTHSALVSAVVLYFLVGTFDNTLLTGLILLRGSMNLRFEAAARRSAFASLVRQAPGFFQRYRTGDLVTRLTDDVADKLSWFLCSGLLRAFAALVVIVFAIVMMIRLDPLLTLLTVAPLPLLILLFIRTGSSLDRRFEAVQERISDLNGTLEACFSGIRVVKAYGREEAEEASFERIAEECRKAEVEAAKSQTLIDSLFGHVWQLGVAIVLLAGGIGVMQGRLTLGTFVAFDAYVLMLIFPMFDIGNLFVRARQSAVSIGRLREIESAPPEIAEPAPPEPVAPLAEAPRRPAGTELRGERSIGPAGAALGRPRAEEGTRDLREGAAASAGAERGFLGARSLGAAAAPAVSGVAPAVGPAVSGVARAVGSVESPEGHLRFESVTYLYGEAGLRGVSFEVGPGEMLAVVGPVGSGKSTLTRLVPRLVDPGAGRILLDGMDLREMPLAPMRAAIGYVPQEAVLFTGTIRENIRMGREELTDEAIEAAAEIAQLNRDLVQLPGGLATRVGVRGMTLSGGQKQRVAVARALAGSPSVLVLDDVTAALDAETEAAFWDRLGSLRPMPATIVITHRTATLERADRILVLRDGHLIEAGTHAELSRSGPVYRSIYHLHSLEERVAGADGERRARSDGGAEAAPGPPPADRVPRSEP